MADDECFICGASVCDEELLESLDLSSVGNLNKTLAKIFQIPAASDFFVESELDKELDFQKPFLCFNCINRVLDAHNLFSQITLLQIKVKAIQYDLCSLMRKCQASQFDRTKNIGGNRGRPSKQSNRISSKYQNLRKTILPNLAKPERLPIESVCQTRTEGPEDIDTEDGRINDIDSEDARVSESDSQENSFNSEIANSINSNSITRKSLVSARKTLKKSRNSQLRRTSSRLRSKSERFCERLATNSSENDTGSNSEVEQDSVPQEKSLVNVVKSKKRQPQSPRQYEPGEDPLLTKLPCPDPKCTTVYFPNDFSLQAHIKRVHQGITKPFDCDLCGKAFLYPTYLRVHKLSHTGEDKFPCSHCNKILKSVKSRRVHEKTHTAEGKPFSCDQCDKAFVNRHHLKSHKISHETDTTFTCDVCGQIYSRARSLELHKRTHDNPQAVNCPTCNKTFATDQSLKVHQELHVKRTNPIRCTQCPFETFTRTEMKRHIFEYHNTKVLYDCEICAKKFASKKTLGCHLQTHTDVKPYKCSICTKHFRDQNTRRRHESLHFKQTFICEVCGKTFAAQAYLDQHFKIHRREAGDEIQRNVKKARQELIKL